MVPPSHPLGRSRGYGIFAPRPVPCSATTRPLFDLPPLFFFFRAFLFSLDCCSEIPRLNLIPCPPRRLLFRSFPPPPQRHPTRPPRAGSWLAAVGGICFQVGTPLFSPLELDKPPTPQEEDVHGVHFTPDSWSDNAGAKNFPYLTLCFASLHLLKLRPLLETDSQFPLN